jgi:hypothetical protein
MVAKVGGVFGTVRHPHLIQPYLAYYDQLASHSVLPYTLVVQLEALTSA